MKLLLDINVVLDVILNRSPWAADARSLFAKIELGDATGYLAGHTVTTIHYVSEKAIGRAATAAAIADLLRLFEVVPVEKADFYHAVSLTFRDFEDAVQAVCAAKVGADYLVTRNETDFTGSTVPVRNPGAILAVL